MPQDRPKSQERLLRSLRYFGGLAGALKQTRARAAVGTARRVVDPARVVVDYFVSERRTVRQGFIAVTIAALTSLLAGLTLAGFDHRIKAIEGLFVLIPVSIGMRGNIFGALAARLGTSIHSGLFETSTERGGMLFQNIHAAATLTIVTSVTMGILGRAIAGLLGIAALSVWDFVVIALAGGVLSSAVVLAVTIYLSIASYNKGWDLDSVGAPLITAIGDLVTLPCLLLATYLTGIHIVTPALGFLAVLGGGFILWRGLSSAAEVARRIVKESFPILCIAIVLDVLAGAVVQPRTETVLERFPALLIVIPGFLEITGALGSILAARLGSKLHLGVVGATIRPDPVALLDSSIIFVLGATVYGLISVATVGLAELLSIDYPGVVRFMAMTMTGGLLATLLASFIGYYAATTTYRFHLDPDNQTIPLVTSGMDLLGVICLVLALAMFGVA